MPCEYCKEDKKLIDAHIIPKPFHPGWGEAAEGVILTGPDNSSYPKRAPVGVYDQSILCADCDAKLGQLDQHAVEKLLRGNSSIFVHQGNAIGRSYDDADAGLMLRFIIAIAWRASIANHEMFRDVTSGPYEAAMLDVLRGRDPKSFDAAIAEFDEEAVGFLNPHQSRFEGVRFMVIYAGKFIFYLKLDKRQMPFNFRPLALRTSGKVRSVLRDYDRSDEFRLLKMLFEQPHLERSRAKWAAGPKRRKLA